MNVYSYTVTCLTCGWTAGPFTTATKAQKEAKQHDNEQPHRDYDDIPEEVRNKLEFVWLEKVEDAVAAGLQQ